MPINADKKQQAWILSYPCSSAFSKLTDRRQGYMPIPRLIATLNRQMEGWANYAFGNINWHLGYRLANHLKHHRSQRPYQLPHLQRLGLKFLRIPPRDSRRRGDSRPRTVAYCPTLPAKYFLRMLTQSMSPPGLGRFVRDAEAIFENSHQVL
jgi:hypothetical protein